MEDNTYEPSTVMVDRPQKVVGNHGLIRSAFENANMDSLQGEQGRDLRVVRRDISGDNRAAEKFADRKKSQKNNTWWTSRHWRMVRSRYISPSVNSPSIP